MAQEQLKALESLENDQNDLKTSDNPAQLLENSLKKLDNFGGFDFLETVIDDVQNLNPERKARKKIFLDESGKKPERDTLKKTLQLWKDVLQSSDDIASLIKTCEDKAEQADKILKKNIKAAVKNTEQLERSYRSVSLFYKNTESTKVKNV